MDNRTDPVEIIARVDELDGKQRAFEVWLYKAHKEGWSVTVESTSLDAPGVDCGVVRIEGLKYRVRHDRRVRGRVAIVSGGRHLIAATVKLTTGEADGVSWTSEFVHAAWAEPIIEDD